MKLESNKYYKLVCNFQGDEGYGAGFDEDWEIDLIFIILTTKEYEFTDWKEFILDNVHSKGNTNTIECVFEDVTEKVKLLHKLLEDDENFDWSNVNSLDLYDKLSSDISDAISCLNYDNVYGDIKTL